MSGDHNLYQKNKPHLDKDKYDKLLSNLKVDLRFKMFQTLVDIMDDPATSARDRLKAVEMLRSFMCEVEDEVKDAA